MNMPMGESTGRRDMRRAPRYAIVAPLQFRGGGGEWVDGTTVNMGRLGVLVRASRPSEPSTRLEMRIDLTNNHTFPASVVICSGRVVRSETAQDGETLVAVTIEDFELQPAVNGAESETRTHAL